ncbi:MULTISPECIES: hypothetical protein [Nitrosomonas]|uniref:hypothetical protein n=1 Tax=Nitrosomonas TaxID=914 RepID=UPI0023F34821|nr:MULTISPECIES: hypothetical protein [Nitrosomonas]
MSITYTLTCADNSELTITEVSAGVFSPVCQSSIAPVAVPMVNGLSDLSWTDVTALIGALLLCCAAAASYNLLFSMFNRK